MAKGPGQREDTPGEDRAEGPAPATEGAKPGEKEAAPNQATQGGSKPGSGKEKTDRAQAQGEKPGEGPGGKKPDKGEKPAETRADRGQQNPGNPETGGLKDPTGEGVPPDRVVKEPDLPKSPADPEHRKRAGALQVEDFTKIDKTILKKLKMSEEELRAFQKAYTEKLQRQETEKLAPPQSGNLRNLGARELKGAPGKASDVRRGGLGQPPPEFRDLFRKYTSNTKH
jgi:hypothetical protein